MSNEREKIVSSVENWEDGTLGGDAEFAAPAPDVDTAVIDESVGIKPISIRLDEKMIAELKLFAEMEGLKYQPMIRVILDRWLEGEKKRYLRYRKSELEKAKQEDLELEPPAVKAS